jgi:hypothetical protein
MTFSIFRGECALGIVDVPAIALRVAATNKIDLVELFGLDRLPAERHLVCRWHRGSDGRLACSWEHSP